MIKKPLNKDTTKAIKAAKNSKKQSQFDYGEIYRQLRTSIEYSSFQKNLQVVNLTSTNPSEGKSSVSSNLAMVSIAKYANVLLIDCDLRKPVQHKIFKVTNKIGLSDLLLNIEHFDEYDDSYFQKFKDNTSEGKLYLLTSGTKVPNPQEMLASEKFKKMIEVLRKRFDFIILDCPPINAVADAIPVSNISDGTIFVISSRETNKNDAKAAITQLKRNGANLLGTVLTKVETEHTNYYNYYYTNE